MPDDRRKNDAAYRVLRHLRELRAFERAHLPFLRTQEDRDLLCEIGHRQAAGTPLKLKELFLLGFGSVATMQRRVRNLRRHGVIEQRACEHDRRAVEVLLHPSAVAVLAAYDAAIARPDRNIPSQETAPS